MLLTPARRRGVEILDDPDVDAAIRECSIADVARSNRWLGGLRAALKALRVSLSTMTAEGTGTLLDVGTGHADIPWRVREVARRRGVRLTTIAVDGSSTLISAARTRVTHAVCADARELPFRSASVDVTLCSQLLHHFEGDDIGALLRELDRVARQRAVVCDLRRSWIAVVGFALAARVLRFHPVTRHDGVASILRGFTVDELHNAIVQATGATPAVRKRLGFRLTATWSPSASRA